MTCRIIRRGGGVLEASPKEGVRRTGESKPIFRYVIVLAVPVSLQCQPVHPKQRIANVSIGTMCSLCGCRSCQTSRESAVRECCKSRVATVSSALVGSGSAPRFTNAHISRPPSESLRPRCPRAVQIVSRKYQTCKPADAHAAGGLAGGR